MLKHHLCENEIGSLLQGTFKKSRVAESVDAKNFCTEVDQ